MPPDHTNVYYALVLILVTEIEIRDGKNEFKRFKAMTGNVCDPRWHSPSRGADPEQAGGRRPMPLPWQAADSARAQQPQP